MQYKTNDKGTFPQGEKNESGDGLKISLIKNRKTKLNK